MSSLTKKRVVRLTSRAATSATAGAPQAAAMGAAAPGRKRIILLKSASVPDSQIQQHKNVSAASNAIAAFQQKIQANRQKILTASMARNPGKPAKIGLARSSRIVKLATQRAIHARLGGRAGGPPVAAAMAAGGARRPATVRSAFAGHVDIDSLLAELSAEEASASDDDNNDDNDADDAESDREAAVSGDSDGLASWSASGSEGTDDDRRLRPDTKALGRILKSHNRTNRMRVTIGAIGYEAAKAEAASSEAVAYLSDGGGNADTADAEGGSVTPALLQRKRAHVLDMIARMRRQEGVALLKHVARDYGIRIIILKEADGVDSLVAGATATATRMDQAAAVTPTMPPPVSQPPPSQSPAVTLIKTAITTPIARQRIVRLTNTRATAAAGGMAGSAGSNTAVTTTTMTTTTTTTTTTTITPAVTNVSATAEVGVAPAVAADAVVTPRRVIRLTSRKRPAANEPSPAANPVAAPPLSVSPAQVRTQSSPPSKRLQVTAIDRTPDTGPVAATAPLSAKRPLSSRLSAKRATAHGRAVGVTSASRLQGARGLFSAALLALQSRES